MNLKSVVIIHSVLLVGFGVFCNEYEYEEDDYSNQSLNDYPIVFLPTQGAYEGFNYVLQNSDRTVKAFLGIKYGNVAKISGRFKRGTRPKDHGSFRESARTAPVGCPSFPEIETVIRNEHNGMNVDDCLTLSVFTPKVSGSLPVIVYIHGEFLFDGSSEESKPDYLLQENIVLISVDYRLAPFGFLFDNDMNSMPGNIALADIEMALEWVNRNVQFFGGDPNNVSVMGQSGGATLAHALALSGKANAYFSKLILMSGTALNPYFIDETPKLTAIEIAKKASCRIRHIGDVSRCFNRLKTSQILEAFKSYKFENHYYTGGKLVIGDRFGYIPQHPAIMNMSPNGVYGSKLNFSLLAGVTQHNGAYLVSRIYEKWALTRPTYNASKFIDIVLEHSLPKHYHEEWKRFALKNIFSPEQIKNGSIAGLTFGLIELVNMMLYKQPLIESVYQFNNDVYLYNLHHRGRYYRYPMNRRLFPFDIGSSLSDENIYLFPYPAEISNLIYDDAQLSTLMIEMWTSFATTGAPCNSKRWPKARNSYGPYVKLSYLIEVDADFTDGPICPNYYESILNNNVTVAAVSAANITTKAPRYTNYIRQS